MKELPPEIILLGAKGIRPGDQFVLRGEGFFTVTRTCRILGVDGEQVCFTENDVWEQFDRIEKCTREDFDQAAEAYREELWRRRGQPDSRELAALAKQFYEDYTRNPEGNSWHWACRYDEETLLRLAEGAAALGKPDARRELSRKLYHDLVLAKALR